MRRWQYSTLRLLFVLLLAGSQLLAGCGQKGPLYLPDPDTEKQEEAGQQR